MCASRSGGCPGPSYRRHHRQPLQRSCRLRRSSGLAGWRCCKMAGSAVQGFCARWRLKALCRRTRHRRCVCGHPRGACPLLRRSWRSHGFVTMGCVCKQAGCSITLGTPKSGVYSAKARRQAPGCAIRNSCAAAHGSSRRSTLKSDSIMLATATILPSAAGLSRTQVTMPCAPQHLSWSA